MASRKRKPDSAKRKRKGLVLWPLYALLFLLLFVFVAFQSSAIVSAISGTAALGIFVVILVLEFVSGAMQEGAKKNIISTLIVVALLVVFWIGLRFVLNTQYPFDVVPSCSMLPVLQRGDMIVIQGVPVSTLTAPVVNITESQAQPIFNSVTSGTYSCVAYRVSGNTATISQQVQPGYTVGLVRSTPSATQILQPNYTIGGVLQYVCGTRQVTTNTGQSYNEAFTTEVRINGTPITWSRNNSVIVYKTTNIDLFHAEGSDYIVHRVYAILNVSGSYYLLTKGDNNPGLDIQYGNEPVNASDVQGKVIASVPYLGYLNLILRQSLSQPAGCNSTVSN
ncbi:MAG: hypothetical protein KGH98_00185 [Candidatus Micrarchaeota archaeon]|nr:hypothetical protein [Candidatus Micrarchaeota archaeon]